MLMDIKCSAVTSIKVDLTFDDFAKSTKTRVIGVGDLIEVEFNQNGLRKHVEGKVIKINAIGNDPKTWYIILDGSGDYASEQYKFSPMSILDVEILRKAESVRYIATPNDCTGIALIRVVDGRMQYSYDGFVWENVVIDKKNIIKDEEGTMPIEPPCRRVEDDCIRDEDY